MALLIPVRNAITVPTSPEWGIDVVLSNDQPKIVDFKGDTISSNYLGRRYRVISCKERFVSILERVKRIFLACVEILNLYHSLKLPLKFALFFRSLINFFNNREVVYFGVLEEFSDEDIKNIAARLYSQNEEPFLTYRTYVKNMLEDINQQITRDLSSSEEFFSIGPTPVEIGPFIHRYYTPAIEETQLDKYPDPEIAIKVIDKFEQEGLIFRRIRFTYNNKDHAAILNINITV